VDPFPDPLHLGVSGGAGNRIWSCGSVGRNSDLYTTEAVGIALLDLTFLFYSCESRVALRPGAELQVDVLAGKFWCI
jgi:hypothetical protein